jgi:cysteine desulfurase/selenocysteine lyase
MEGITIYGNSPERSGVISFNLEGVHPYDIGMLLDKMGIAVRTGHHCADTVMQHYQIQGTVRISFGIYNTIEEIDIFLGALKKIRQMLA